MIYEIEKVVVKGDVVLSISEDLVKTILFKVYIIALIITLYTNLVIYRSAVFVYLFTIALSAR